MGMWKEHQQRSKQNGGSFEFTATVFRYKGTGGWFLVELPQSLGAQLDVCGKRGACGFIKVRARIGATQWETSIAPGGGKYFLPLKAEVRKKEKVGEGDEVSVAFEFL